MPNLTLWLGVHLPHLPLNVFARPLPDEQPLVIAIGEQTRQQVLACNAAASRHGIIPGMKVSAAYALAPQLHIQSRQLAMEQQFLERLAGWAFQFSSLVTLMEQQGIMLGIGRSLALFGGLSSLMARIHDGLEELGYQAHLAVAPTPLGAWWLARAREPHPVWDRKTLRQTLARLPLSVLELPDNVLASLNSLGLRHVGGLLCQPRAELTQRFGQALTADLYKALGLLPDPRPTYQPPHFHGHLLLPAEVNRTEALLFALRRLVLELAGYLAAREAGVQRFTVLLMSHRPPNTPVRVGLVKASRDARHLLDILRERLERVELANPVVELQLNAGEILPLAPQPGELWQNMQHSRDETLLIELLQARLDPDAVQGVWMAADHRPEKAWRYTPPGKTGTRCSIPHVRYGSCPSR